MEKKLEVMNIHMVGVAHDGILIMNPPKKAMTKEEALSLAAWIVVLAENERGQFQEYLDAVMDT